jgi:acetylornithine deacetylase/succinyl-diaminopimelate desuccinylase-like protein
MVLETEEESGSKSLVYLLDKNKDILLNPDICICMDSGCLDYESIWLTSTLRGVLNFDLSV